MINLSVVIIAGKDDYGIDKLFSSIKNLADEIVVIDTGMIESSRKLAQKYKAKIYSHAKVQYVELIRNFAINKANGNWILIMDPDEVVSKDLRHEIEIVIKKNRLDYYRIARKNVIFGKWIENSRWWPDYNIRLFKKGKVSWNEIIHGVPITIGKGADFEAKESLAIIHNSYNNIDEYFIKMLRYTKAQAENLTSSGYKFVWSDLITKPTNEFLSRFFAGQGYRDGIHGLVLSLLQAFSELVLHIRLWGYKDIKVKNSEFKGTLNKSINDLKWWIRKEFSWLKNLPFVS